MSLTKCRIVHVIVCLFSVRSEWQLQSAVILAQAESYAEHQKPQKLVGVHQTQALSVLSTFLLSVHLPAVFNPSYPLVFLASRDIYRYALNDISRNALPWQMLLGSGRFSCKKFERIPAMFGHRSHNQYAGKARDIGARAVMAAHGMPELTPIDMLNFADDRKNAGRELVLPDDWLDLAYEDSSKHVHVDVGCARGRFCIEYAQLNPDINVLGLEIMQRKVLNANNARRRMALPNCFFLLCDATTHLDQVLGHLAKQDCLRSLSIQFPSPGVCLVTPAQVQSIAEKMRSGGFVFLQGEVLDTVLAMRKCFRDHELFQDTKETLDEWLESNPLVVPTEWEGLVEDLPVRRCMLLRIPEQGADDASLASQRKSLERLTVVELRARLKEKGFRTGGKKFALIQRLLGRPLPESSEDLELQQLTVAQLREQCREKGLAVSGTKAMLLKRLNPAL